MEEEAKKFITEMVKLEEKDREKEVLKKALIGSMISLIKKSFKTTKKTYSENGGWTNESIWDIDLGFKVVTDTKSDSIVIILNVDQNYLVGYMSVVGEVEVKNEMYYEFVKTVYRYFDKGNHSLGVTLATYEKGMGSR